MIKRIFVSLLLSLICWSYAFAETTKTQRLILNEPITMMALLIQITNLRLKADYPRLNFILKSKQSNTPFAIDTKDGKDVRTNTSIKAFLDFQRGKWIISYKLLETMAVDKILPTTENAINICKAMLDEIQHAKVNILDALHKGYQKSRYDDVLQKRSIEEADNTIHRASLNWHNINIQMECEREYNWANGVAGVQKEPSKISLSGAWK